MQDRPMLQNLPAQCKLPMTWMCNAEGAAKGLREDEMQATVDEALTALRNQLHVDGGQHRRPWLGGLSGFIEVLQGALNQVCFIAPPPSSGCCSRPISRYVESETLLVLQSWHNHNHNVS